MTRYPLTSHQGITLVPATPVPADPGGRGEDFGKASPLGFLLLLVFFIAVAFLIRSMNKHLKRLPKSFDPPEPTAIDKSEVARESTDRDG